MNARAAFDCISVADNDATNLGHKCVHLSRAIENKISSLRTQPVFAEEILLGTVINRLHGMPVAEFDQTREELARHLKKHGCCEIKAYSDRYTLTELAQQMESTAELLAPFRKLLEAQP